MRILAALIVIVGAVAVMACGSGGSGCVGDCSFCVDDSDCCGDSLCFSPNDGGFCHIFEGEC